MMTSMRQVAGTVLRATGLAWLDRHVIVPMADWLERHRLVYHVVGGVVVAVGVVLLIWGPR